MTFLIADTFSDSLARLTGDEQNAVKTTAFDRASVLGSSFVIFVFFVASMPFVDGRAWDVEGCSPDDFDGLVEALWRMCGPFIQAGEYSMDDYVWHRLTAGERSAIEDLLRE